MFFLVLVENSPRYAQFFVNQRIFHIGTAKYSWRILQMRLYSLRAFSMHAKILLAYSEKIYI
jgi:hypothetical protein